MKYQSSSQDTCMMNNTLLPLQVKCFNLLALKHWFTSEQSSMCRRKAGQPVLGYLQWLLQGASCENLGTIQCENLELLLSVKLCFQLLCLYHARHYRAQPSHILAWQKNNMDLSKV